MADVHRDLEKGDKGADVKALQRALNDYRDRFKAICRFKYLEVDGGLGQKSIRAAHRVAYLTGLAEARLKEIEAGKLSQSVQKKLRGGRLSAEDKARGEKRRKEARKPKPPAANFNGHPTNVAEVIVEVIAQANKHGLYVTATTDGTHTPSSYHYPANSPTKDNKGHAVDVAGTRDAMIAFQHDASWEWENALEIFGPDDYYVKNGTRVGGAFPGHQDHVHVAR